MTVIFPRLGQAGRIGNQLWQVAATVGIAGDKNDDFLLPEDWDYRPYFNIPDWCYGPQVGVDAGTLPQHIDERARVYLQDFGLFQYSETFIRELLSFTPLAIETACASPRVLEGFWDLPRPWTSVHVRRGDNVTHPLGYHPLRSESYYKAAMKLIPNPGTVIVFSDDEGWCIDHMPDWLNSNESSGYHPSKNNFKVQSGPKRPREYADRLAYDSSDPLDWIDLYLMSLCDYHVMANSSYSWWGAFLSNDPTPIFPSNWFGYLVSSYTDAGLMFPPGWIEVHDPTQGGV